MAGSGNQHESAEYWRHHLEELSPCQFPRLGAKGVQRTKRPMTVRMSLQDSIKLQEICSSGAIALPAILRAVWALVLRCYTDSEDVCFGYQETGSGQANSSSMAVARLKFSDEMTLDELVEAAKGEYTQSLPHHSYVSSGSFNAVKMGQQRPFNTVLVLRTLANVGKTISSPAAAGPFNVMLPEDCAVRILVKQINGTVSMFLEWWNSEMNMDQALDVASTFDKILTTTLNSPQENICQLDAFTGHHMKRISKWNSKPLEKVNKCIHQVFQDQASRRPDAEAICAWDGSFSYREFDEVTSRLANHLVSMGVGPEVRVPCCFEKSKWYPVAAFAVMKAGGAFVPLDPSHPIPRLQSLINKLEASILLSSAEHLDHLSQVIEAVIPIDETLIESLPPVGKRQEYVPRCEPENAGYLIFTSGSTGEPKGTVIEHTAYVSGATAHAPILRITADSRCLQFAAHTFDASLVEMVTPLLVGGTVCIPSEEARMNDIVGAINAMGVNHATLTPSFVTFIAPAQVPSLATLILAGEAMSQSHVDVWSSRITLINGYGPTEASVCATTNAHVTPSSDPKDIGFPVGLHCWVVNPDDHDRLVAPGCTGELLLEGPSLAREYLANPEKTNDAFIYGPRWAQPLPDGTRRRFYKTGDLVRYNSPQGSFNYVGRKDTQIKFHGQRVELGEIEHHVVADPSVKHGLVLFPKTGCCKGHIVSIFTLTDNCAVDGSPNPDTLRLVDRALRDPQIEAIRQRLNTRLPSYMVPSISICVQSLPMLSSRKLDRKAVSKWVDSVEEELFLQIAPVETTTDDHGEAANKVEDQIRNIWSRVLNFPLNRVGLNQSFLSLGGDSITAMTCMGQCKKVGLGFTVQEVLRSKSIRELAACAKAIAQAIDYKEEVDYLFDLTPIQQYHFQVRTEGQGYFNQSFFLKLSQPTSEASLRQAVGAIVERHSMLRARFSKDDVTGQWKQRIVSDIASSYRLRTHKIRSRAGADAAIADSQNSMDSRNGPLFTADLFDVDGGEQLLSMIGHHLVIDLVSWRVILEDLEELLLNPQNPSLAAKSIPFQTWSKLQIDHCQDIDLSKVIAAADIPSGDFAYWDVDPHLNTYGAAACEGFEIDTTLTSLLLTECHDSLRTEPVDILVATLIHSFSETFPDRVVPAIYNEGHGRETWDDSIDISRTVGWFTTVYPVFVPAVSSDKITDTVMAVKDIRRRVPGNGRPYFAGRFHTADGRSKFSHHAPMEVSFNYLGQYQQLERNDALLQPVDEMAGEAREAGGSADYDKITPRFGLFEISAVVASGKLRFAFTFNRNMKYQPAIRQWVSQCQHNLRRVADELVSMTPRVTLSDFPLLSLTYKDLSALETEKLPRIGVSSINDMEDAYPCSPIQQGLLISSTKDGAVYAVQGTFEVQPRASDKVDMDRLASAWLQVVAHHPALRTVFLEDLTADGLYNQVCLKKIDAELLRLRCHDDEDVVPTFEKQEPTNYETRKPPHRFSICQTSHQKVFCRIEMSHSIMDGASISIIFRDLAVAYAGKLAEQPATGFGKFIGYLQEQPASKGIDFWSAYLSGVEPCHFPTLNDGRSSDKTLQTLRLEYKKLKDLQSFCDTNGLTLSNAINTAWALTLRVYIGSDEMCFGYMSSGRDAPIPGIEDAVGPFINMLACRVNMPAEAPLRKILEDVQKDYMDSLPHKHASLAEVQHALKLSDTALFNTCVSYRRLPPATESEQIIDFVSHCPIHDPTEYPVSLNIEVSDVEVAIDLDYWTDSICDRQAASIANTFVRCLENIAYNSEQAVGQLDNVSIQDYEAIWSWNKSIPDTIKKCVHEVVAEMTETRPDAPAICAWDGEFTYRELDEASTVLANYLAALGVAPETFVPICFDKSAWTIVSMLAVLKAGGACVPLDATHPKDALEYKVMDCGAELVMASPQRAAMFEDITPYVVAVDAELLEQISGYDEFYGTRASYTNPCFVIFTSGSTGKPKGVVLEHRSIVTSAEAHGSALGIGPDTRILQFAAYTFDNSLEEMFTTLMRGGCVCVPSEEDRFNNLAGAINRLNANFMDLTPTVALLLRPADVPCIKSLAVGGEAMTKRVKEIWGSIPIHNQYGPSECSINCTHNPDSAAADVSNIGKSVGSVSWVVDPIDHNRLVPVGAVGELLVEGPIVSRGYLNDPEKTAKAFITSPLWTEKDPILRTDHSRRMYKTGDLVRYDSDGSIVYIGRKDNQVKLNGQRIELGEIEHHVKVNLPESAQSAVQLVVRDGAKALAVFLCTTAATVTDSDGILLPMTDTVHDTASALESALSAAIPTYMVPSVFIPVSKMPLTASGKLDRRALSRVGQTMSDEQASTYRLAGSSSSSTKPPTTDTEKTLQHLWASILSKSTDVIGVDDSFFQHGGDSIGAMKLVSAARLKGLSLSVATIFQKPTLSQMAASCHGSPKQPGNLNGAIGQRPIEPFSLLPRDTLVKTLLQEVADICDIEIDSVQDIYPCTSIQGGLVALSSKQPGAYVAQNIFELPSDIDFKRFKNAWQAVADADAVLRTRIVFTEELGFLQVVIREHLPWHYFNSMGDLADEHRNLPACDGGALSRYTIIGENSRSPQFVWTVHHALYDGWSIPTLLDRVAACYRNLNSLTTVNTPFSAFIQYLSSIDSKSSDDFWRSHLDDPKCTAWPRLPSPQYQVNARNKASRVSSIEPVSSRETTVASIIRAAWALITSLYSYSDDVIFGEMLTGRDAPVPGIEDMIGPTFTSIPSRIHINRDLTVNGFLKDVQDQFVKAMPHQFTGLQNIKRLGSDAAMACDFQNLLTITQDADESANGFWNMTSSGTTGSNFFSYPLNISCTIAKLDIRIDAHYDPDIIPKWQVEKLLTHLDTLLRRLASSDHAQTVLGDLNLMECDDLDVIEKLNANGATVYNRCIHDMVYDQVRSNPDSLSLDTWDGTFTFKELDEMSTNLAHDLINLGVCSSPEVFVPLVFEKSAFMVIAMLGVLKAGGAFTPLDPAHPVSRLQEITCDLGATLVLCSPKYKDLSRNLAPKTLAVDMKYLQSLQSRGAPLPSIPPSNPAYVIFTSGTTGKPKGIIIEHRNFCSSAMAHGPVLFFKPKRRVLQFASFTFDASLLETLSALIFGACVCIPNDFDRLNDIQGFINKMNVDWAEFTPSFIHLLTPEDVPNLKTVSLVGEALSESHILTWANKVQLVNGYGPTEASALAVVNNKITTKTSPVNIGQQLDRCWIVDARNHNRLVPIGAVGELLVEGPTVGRCYLNNPEKTEAAFIMNPEWTQETPSNTRKMYKTGDLVRYSGDGLMDIIYIGRKDTQTKVRGQRLEVDEVEHHLRADQAVSNCLVMVPSKGLHAKKLVAAVFSTNIVKPDSSERLAIETSKAALSDLSLIRERLRRRLPPFMVPTRWVCFKEVPIMPSGKLDRRQIIRFIEGLEERDEPSPLVVQEKEAKGISTIDVVAELQKVYSYVLKLSSEEVEAENSSFLHLGGDSISAMQVMAKCRSNGLSLSVQDIMQAKSIKELASKVKPSKSGPKIRITDKVETTEKERVAEPIQTVNIGQELQKVWSHVLKLPLEEVDMESSFLHLGGDSISAMQVMARCRSQGIGVAVQDIMQVKSIAELSTKTKVSGTAMPARIVDKKAVTNLKSGNPFNLSPIQQLYMECVGENWQQFNQSLLMRLASKRLPEDVAKALDTLITAHPMLRARFFKAHSGKWQQRISSEVSESYRLRVHHTVPSQIQSLIESSQKCLDIENGPLFAVDIFHFSDADSQISFIAHHLIVDVVSWNTILQDLEDALVGSQLTSRDSTSFQQWCDLQDEDAQTHYLETVLPSWDVPQADFEYWGMADTPNLNGDVLTEKFELSLRSTSDLLTPCRKSSSFEPVDVILAAMLLSFRQVFSDRETTPAVYNEGHGREPWDASTDISSTVGWFTTMSPVYLPTDADVSGANGFCDLIRWVADFRRRMPGKGRPYFAYRFLTENGRGRFGNHWPMELCFNYLGQMKHNEESNDILQPIGGAGGQSVNTLSDIGSKVPRFSLIDISAVIKNGRMSVSFDFNTKMKRRASILKWISGCHDLLIEAPLALEKLSRQSIKDFPLLPITYGGMTKLEVQLPEIGISSMDEIEDIYPPSPVQQGILISQLKDPKKYAFHFAFEVKSNRKGHLVDPHRLEKAWQAVVSRHSSLRTVFIESIDSKGLLDQVVLKNAKGITLFVESKSAEDVFADTDAFDCSTNRLPHRFTICKSFDRRVFCRIEISHAISDGTSMGLLLGDLTTAYETETALPHGPAYSDFIKYLQSTPKENGLQYWRNYLSGTEPCLLPSLAKFPRHSSRSAGEHVFTIDQGSQLRSFCRKHGLTPANVLQVVWGLVLRAYIGTDEVCFGVVSSGRNVPVAGVEDAVGAFINMIICRLVLSPTTLLDNVLQKIQTDFVNSMDYQSCSLTEVQHDLGLSDTSLFNTVFTFQKSSTSLSTDPVISFDHLSSTDPNEFNISINVSLLDSSLVIGLGYWSDTVSDEHAVYISKTFEHILRTIIQDGGCNQMVGELDLFSEHSSTQIRSWNSQPPKVVNKCVHSLIEQQALLRPRNTMAVNAWDASFTYLELNTLTSRLAAHLTTIGVGPDVYVPLCFEKSAWTVVAQLAVLKAGGAFVHVDPAHPESRLRMLIDDVGADVVICSPKYSQKASKVSNRTFVLDPTTIRNIQDDQTPATSSARPSDVAYVIFTSGTTGRPKGTIIEHGAICTSALAHGEGLLMDSSSRVFQFASYTFDASIMEILTCLIMGGCVCIPSDEERSDDLPKAITQYKASWMFVTPSVLSTMKPEQIPTMKVIAIGGEAMSEKIMEEWRGGPAILNVYGPTENSVISSASLKVDRDGVTQDENRSNIGYGLGCRTWIVDANNYNRLVPVGAIGELILEGRMVSRGYLNNPQKTAEVFIENPEFTEDSRFRGLFSRSWRMYRTGDLVRYNPDGTINFISRKDTQIKLNGQRIELGEIEYHCKASLPDQTQAAVELVVPSDRAKKTLAVFFSVSTTASNLGALVKADGTASDELLVPMNDDMRSVANALETSLGSSIPTYMIPHLFVPVSKLPWTSSGKLDRNRLRNSVQDLSKDSVRSFRLGISMGNRAAASGIEKILQSMWEKVLDLPSGSVSTGDSFFRLGGDSLAAMQLAGGARSQGISLTFVNIFKCPILADMARTCGTAKGDLQADVKPFELIQETESVDKLKQEAAELCRVDESDINDIYPASSLQEGFITLAVKQPGAYVAKNVFRLGATVDVVKFKAAWQAVVQDLDMLRTRIVHSAYSDFIQVVLKHETICWNSYSTLTSISNEAIQLPSHNGGRLATFSIVDDLPSATRYFVLTISHAIYDGWSLPLMLKRVENAYFGQDSLQAQTAYVKFIQYLTQADIVASENFWRSKLSGISSVNFPNVSYSYNEQHSTTQTISSCTKLPSRKSGDITVPTIIRAAWALLVAGHTATDDVCFGETLTGRNIDVPGIADIVGPTLTTVPTRIQINRTATLSSYLGQVQQDSADSVSHQHFGLQRIKRLDGDAAAACDFQNLLVVQTAQEQIKESFWNFHNNDDDQDFFTYPLVLECSVDGTYVKTTAYFKENAMSSWQMERVLGQFGSIMKQLINKLESPEATVKEIDIFSLEDKEIVSFWNRPTPLVVNECIHDIFTRRADSQPDSPAVCDSMEELTYEELQDYASRLALHLVGMGIGPEVLVPVCLDKSAWAVVTIMAILMAGGAFVPLDPGHPRSRHQEILEETNANVVLCSSKYHDRFAKLVRDVVIIDKMFFSQLPRPRSCAELLGRAKPENTAYVIFTSGSTGRAKGVVIEHRSFSSSSAAFGPAALMNSQSRVLQFASLSFDASVMEILTPLTLGGCVCVPSEEERLNKTAKVIQRMKVTWALLTPSVANIIDPNSVPCLEVLVCGGEALSPEVISKWSDKVQLVNAYGPSEASVVATINSNVSFEKNPACIGFGTPATTIWVLDPVDHNRLAPLGAAGELALEGLTLARGYLKNPQKTQEAFIEAPDWTAQFPSSASSARRIYKTGDLVKYNPNGSIEFIGRKDNQVKINGQRMELGEIEHRLDTDSRIRHVLVLMPKGGRCKKRLVAVASLDTLFSEAPALSNGDLEVVTDKRFKDEIRSQLNKIQENLSSQLPPFMVPQIWAVVKAIPLLASGKLDRKKVASWVENMDGRLYEEIMGIEGKDDTPIRAHGMAKVLQQIWSTVLNIPLNKVKLNQSFMSLGKSKAPNLTLLRTLTYSNIGGDSITAMSVMSRCRREGISLSLHDVLRCKSILNLVESVGATVSVIQKEEIINEQFGLSPIQRLYFASSNSHSGRERFNQSFSLRFSRQVHSSQLQKAIEAIIGQHSMLRARFSQGASGIWQQMITDDINRSHRYRVHDLNDHNDLSAIVADSQTTLNIEHGPVFAADLFNIRSNNQLLFLAAHHLCVDMVSWRIILQDIQDYLETGSLSVEKPLSFQAWCAMQAGHCEKHKSAGALPFDVTPSNLRYWGMENRSPTYQDAEQRTFQVDKETTNMALKNCHKVFQTEPIDLFLAIIAHSFSRVFSDREIPTLFNEGHGRETWQDSLDISRTVGWFTTICPIHIAVESDDVMDTLRRTKDIRRKISDNGRSYFAQRFLTSAGKINADIPMEILFNYLGRMQQLERDDSLLQQFDFTSSEEDILTTSDVGPDTKRFALFEVSAIVLDDQIQFSFTFDRTMKRITDIIRWVDECKNTLRETVLRLAHSTPEPTLSDYPLLPLSYEGLKKLVRSTYPKARVSQCDQVEDIYPCSPMQEGILLSQLRDPNSYLFNCIFEAKLKSTKHQIDHGKLSGAWLKVVQRHAALRTVFVDSVYRGGTFDQLVLKRVDSGIVFVDCHDSEAITKLD
ncbi:hypothetical protein LOZ35_006030, partial [Ophidiomyces ophidiicola]